MCKIELNNIYNMDCFESMKNIAGKSIDMILCDLPYGETGNSWDKELDLTELFGQYTRIAKDDAAIVLTGTFKFGVKLYNAAPYDFHSYLLYMEKDRDIDKRFYQPRVKVLRSLVQDLQDLADGKLVRLGISMPPGTGKSTLGIFYITWLMCREPLKPSLAIAHDMVSGSEEALNHERMEML